MAHTVAHRILRMIHAENERSTACTLRGDAYALTILRGNLSIIPETALSKRYLLQARHAIIDRLRRLSPAH
ncbi:hypothetical protein ACFFNA_34285, partial [Mesorhizobium kowhaii]|uniref:hypothetical protein n=1 Tax=Mesorhizobium kowhaii TaxID=1300272 RepID=UPI0035E9A6DD